MTAADLLTQPAVPLEQMLMDAGLATSRSDGRRLIAAGAITLRRGVEGAPWKLTAGSRYWVVRDGAGVRVVGVAKESGGTT